jgi:hypothetical protein
MHPDNKQVIPVTLEAIKNKDGTKRQDCELNASKRFIANLRAAYPRQKVLLCGDGLMSNQPLIKETLAGDMHYLFVAKQGNHKYLVEWLNAYDVLPITEWTYGKGKRHIYSWKNGVLLNGNDKTIMVNWFQYQFKNSTGKITKTHSWVTDIEMNKTNVITMTKAGRC